MIRKDFRILALMLIAGVCVLGVRTHAQQSPPPGYKRPVRPRQIAKPNPNVAAIQNAPQAVKTGTTAISPQDLPENPLRTAINNAIQKAKQEGLLRPVAAQISTRNIATGAVSGTPPNTGTTPGANAAAAAMPNAAADAAEFIQRNAPTNAMRATNPNLREPANSIQVPADLQRGITAMQDAISNLAKAGLKWGGHKQRAARFINQALAACGQPVVHPVEAESSGDESTAMAAAYAQIARAKNDFDNAGDDWGGRRDKARSSIDQALQELQLGIDFAKNHNTY